MNLRSLSHKEFIQLLAENPEDAKFWEEFFRRYSASICNKARKTLEYYNFPKNKVQNVEDFLYRVIFILISNGAKPLKDFNSKYENGIFSYLNTITYFEVLKFIKKGSNPSFTDIEGNDKIPLETIMPQQPSEIEAWEKLEDVEYCLEKAAKVSAKHTAKQRRNLLIGKLSFFYKLSPEEISRIGSLDLDNHLPIKKLTPQEYEQVSDLSISEKRVYGIIQEMRNSLEKCLKRDVD